MAQCEFSLKNVFSDSSSLYWSEYEQDMQQMVQHWELNWDKYTKYCSFTAEPEHLDSEGH